MIGLRRPSWFAVLLTVAGVLLFVRLGIWQLHRAAEKEALQRRYDAALELPPRDLREPPPVDAQSRPLRLRIHGSYLAERIYRVDDPHHDGRGGAEVYVPLQLDPRGPWLLVDLGFLPGGDDQHLPPPPALPRAPQTLVGLYQPPPGHGLELGGDAYARERDWPKDSIYLDLAQVGADLRHPLYPWVLALDADPATPYRRDHHFDFASMPPSRHRAYAFQWFTFAVAAVVIFLVLHRRRPPGKPR